MSSMVTQHFCRLYSVIRGGEGVRGGEGEGVCGLNSAVLEKHHSTTFLSISDFCSFLLFLPPPFHSFFLHFPLSVLEFSVFNCGCSHTDGVCDWALKLLTIIQFLCNAQVLGLGNFIISLEIISIQHLRLLPKYNDDRNEVHQ